MANYMVTDTELTNVANAIRTKGGTSAGLIFPDGFVSAINAIDGGGGGGSPLDDLLELVDTVTVASDTAEIVIDTPTNNGCFFLIMSPLVNGQDGVSANTNVFKAAEFSISKANRTIANGTTYLFNRTGVSDYWSISVAYVDSTNAQIKIKGNSGGNIIFLANHDLLIYRVKGD